MIVVTHERSVAEATDKIIRLKDGLIESIEESPESSMLNKQYIK
jgi:ABC-type antimicrobial peptide transport system, ATPase component